MKRNRALVAGTLSSVPPHIGLQAEIAGSIGAGTWDGFPRSRTAVRENLGYVALSKRHNASLNFLAAYVHATRGAQEWALVQRTIGRTPEGEHFLRPA